MVNLKYLVSILKSALYESTSIIIRKTMFLNSADIRFLEDNHCLVSIKQISNSSDSFPTLDEENSSHQYNVELNANSLRILCS